MKKPLSIRKFAAAVGVSHVAVMKAIKSGRLVDSVQRDSAGTFLGIEEDRGREEWEMNSSKPVSRAVAEKNQEPETTQDAPPSYAESRALRESYQAKIARLVFEEKISLLVEAEAVKTRAFEVSRLVRDTVLNLPSRISAELAAETDADIIFAKLTRELTQALDGLSARIIEEGSKSEQ